MKLVLMYTVGDGFTYSSDITTPFVYSSKDDFLVDLEIKAEEYLKAMAQYRADVAEYLSKKQQGKVDAHDRPKDPSEFVKFSGFKCLLDITDFIEGDDNEFFAPEVLPLDEWFTSLTPKA